MAGDAVREALISRLLDLKALYILEGDEAWTAQEMMRELSRYEAGLRVWSRVAADRAAGEDRADA